MQTILDQKHRKICNLKWITKFYETFSNPTPILEKSEKINILNCAKPIFYPGSQAPFWGEEVTSPAIVGLNTILVRLCHPIEGLGGLLTKFFWRDG